MAKACKFPICVSPFWMWCIWISMLFWRTPRFRGLMVDLISSSESWSDLNSKACISLSANVCHKQHHYYNTLQNTTTTDLQQLWRQMFCCCRSAGCVTSFQLICGKQTLTLNSLNDCWLFSCWECDTLWLTAKFVPSKLSYLLTYLLTAHRILQQLTEFYYNTPLDTTTHCKILHCQILNNTQDTTTTHKILLQMTNDRILL